MKGDKQSSQFKFSHSVVLPPIRLRETFYRSTIRQLDLQRCRQQLNNTRQIAKSRNSLCKCFYCGEAFFIHICKYKIYYPQVSTAAQPPGNFPGRGYRRRHSTLDRKYSKFSSMAKRDVYPALFQAGESLPFSTCCPRTC